MSDIPEVIPRFFQNSSIPLTLSRRGDRDQPLLLANSAFEELTGYDLDEIVGHNCRFLQGPDTRDRDRQEIRIAIEERIDTQVLIQNYRKTGEPFMNLLFIRHIAASDGSELLLGSQFRLERMEMDARLADHLETLNRGSAQIVEEAIGLSIKSKSVLSSAVAHYLRSQLG